MNEVRLDHDPVSWQPTFDELTTGELGEGDEDIHRSLPGAQEAMDDEHGRHRPGRRPAASVTAVQYTGPGHELAQAVLADMIVTVEDRVGADQAVVVQGQDDRKAGPMGRDEHCR